MKNDFNGFINRLDQMKKKISELEEMSKETSKIKMQREKSEKDKTGYQELRDSYKRHNIHAVGIPKGYKKEEGTKEIFEAIMIDSFPKLMTDIKLYIYLASRINTRKVVYSKTHHIKIAKCQRHRQNFKRQTNKPVYSVKSKGKN